MKAILSISSVLLDISKPLLLHASTDLALFPGCLCHLTVIACSMQKLFHTASDRKLEPGRAWKNSSICPVSILYRIAENFRGRKLSRFCGDSRKFSPRNLGAWRPLAREKRAICESFLPRKFSAISVQFQSRTKNKFSTAPSGTAGVRVKNLVWGQD